MARLLARLVAAQRPLGAAVRRLQPPLADAPCSARSGRSRTCSTAAGSATRSTPAVTDIPIGLLLARSSSTCSASRRRPTSPSSATIAVHARRRRDRRSPTTPTPTARPGRGRPLHATLMVVALVVLLVSLGRCAPATRPTGRSPVALSDRRLPRSSTAGRLRRRRRRLRPRQHGQPARVPRRRDEVDPPRHRRRRRPRDDLPEATPTKAEGRDQRPRARPHRRHGPCACTRSAPMPAGRSTRARSSTAASSARGTAPASG